MTVTVNDIDELPVFSKRKVFLQISFEVHGSGCNSVKSIRESYFKAEVIFAKQFHSRAYKTDECFSRTYYYHLNRMLGKPTVRPKDTHTGGVHQNY